MTIAVVLLSGGLDSAVCLGLALEAHREVHALHVGYGQQAQVQESRAAARIFNELTGNVSHVHPAPGPHRYHRASSALATLSRCALVAGGVLEPTLPGQVSSAVVPGRNSVLVAYAVSLAETVGASAVYVGANADDHAGFPDCRPGFFRAWRTLANVSTSGPGRIDILTPLAGWAKPRIALEARRLGVDVAATWSCYTPADGAPCGACDACRLRDAPMPEGA